MPAKRMGSADSRPQGTGSWLDELRNALAFALFAAIYALLAGSVLRLTGGTGGWGLFSAFLTGYLGAVLLFLGAHALAWTLLTALRAARRPALVPLAGPLVSLVACAAALPRLWTTRSMAELIQTASFLGAGLAFSTAHGFTTGLQQRLVPARRVRDLLAARPALGQALLGQIGRILRIGPLLPWLASGLLFLLLPPALQSRLGAYWILLTFLAHLVNRKLLEELAVWVFLHALRAGDYISAGQLPIRPGRLTAEIQTAPPDLEAAFARFIVYGMAGPEGVLFTPAVLGRMVPVYLSAYGAAAADQGAAAKDPEGSLVRRLLERGMRFEMEVEAAQGLEPLRLPRWTELARAEARARLAALHPDEPLWQVIARLYEVPIRGLLLPISLLWLPLLGVALAQVEAGRWLLPLVGAALSFGLLVWLTLFYGNWIFDQSLRCHDFPFLARQLANRRLWGELEDALGHRDPKVRERAIELLLFDDEIARLGITVPPAGLRKFLRRAR
jgi:hypothetical protein